LVYMQARIQLQYGMVARFNAAMARLVPLMEARGWKLVGSWNTVVGDLHEVLDIWEVRDLNHVGEAMSTVVTDAGFPEIGAELAATIRTEVTSIMVKTPFAP
jgi:hypothetical protein